MQSRARCEIEESKRSAGRRGIGEGERECRNVEQEAWKHAKRKNSRRRKGKMKAEKREESEREVERERVGDNEAGRRKQRER